MGKARPMGPATSQLFLCHKVVMKSSKDAPIAASVDEGEGISHG